MSIKFFLYGITETYYDSIKTIENINSLIKSDEEKVFNYIKEHPIISIGSIANELHLSFNGVSNSVKKLVELDILTETSTKSRNRVFEYTKYLNILKSGT